MDFFDRVSRIIDAALAKETYHSPGDADYASAWQELDDYLNGAEAHYRGESRPRPESGIPQEVLQAYRDLEVSPFASADEIHDAYRSLQVRYHPDRYGTDPQRQHLATEIATRLNASYARIRRYLEGG